MMNRIPSLVAASLLKDRELHPSDRLPPEVVDRVTLMITLRNMDAQKLYNYCASTAAELLSLHLNEIRQHYVVKKEEA